MPVPLLNLKAQYATIRDEVHAAIDRVVGSQQFILGPEVEALEREVAEYSQCEFAIGVSSGTDALLVSLMAIGLQPGDEVITTPYTFFATAGAVWRLGAKPVFVDVDPVTYNIDPMLIEEAITSRTKAILPVHLFGQMAEMDPIMEIAGAHDMQVVEDAAQAIGAEYKGCRAGSIGHLGCFSFFPSKNLGGFGDGGMVSTNDPDLAQRVRMLRSHGSSPKYYHSEVGGNFRLDGLQAAVLRVKLRHLDDWTGGRQQNAATYQRLFREAALSMARAGDQWASSPGEADVALPAALPDRRHIFNQFVIRAKRRDELAAFLREAGIYSEVYYPVPLHLQKCFQALGHRPGDLQVSEEAACETLALPVYPELTVEMQASVADSISRFYEV